MKLVLSPARRVGFWLATLVVALGAPAVLAADLPSSENPWAADQYLEQVWGRRDSTERALRYFQREWRSDPHNRVLLSNIVVAADSLGNLEVAARYALLPECPPLEPSLRERLISYALQQDDHALLLPLLEQKWNATRGGPRAERLRTGLLLAHARQRQFEYRAAAELYTTCRDSLGLFTALESGELGSPTRLLRLMGQCLMKAKRYPEARDVYQLLAANSPAPAEAHYWLGRIALEQHEPLAALEYAQTCLQQDHDFLEYAPYELLESSLIAVNDGGRYDSSLAHISGAMATIVRAERLHNEGRNRAAEAALAPLLARIEESTEPERTVATAVHRQCAWLAEERRIGDLFTLVARLAAAGWDVRAWQAELDELAEAPAIKSLMSAAAAQRAPSAKSDAARWALIAFHLACDEEAHAAAVARDLLAAIPAASRSDALGEWCFLLHQRDAHDLLAEFLNWGLEQQVWPQAEVAQAYLSLASIEVQRDNPLAAQLALREATQRVTATPEIDSLRLYCAQELAGDDQAIALGKEILQRRELDDSPTIRKHLKSVRMMLSNLWQEHDPPLAIEALEQVLDEFPNDAGAKNDLGYLLAVRGERLTLARRLTQEAVDAHPENAAYWDSLGWVAFRQHDYPMATKALEQSYALIQQQGDEADYETLDHLGELYHATGRPTDAQIKWRAAADRLPVGDPRRVRIEAKLKP